jgi:hypothetical protein
MLAASRKDRVAGRAAVLLDSINTRAGFNHSGAPPGSRLARNLVGLFRKEEMIKLNQPTKPKDMVNSRWLEALNV